VSLPLYTGEDTSSEQAIFGNGISSNGVRIGYNNTTNVGYINALKPAVAWSTLVIGGTNVVFTANGNERVRVTTNGLTFNGDTAAANALDDYEEGTFTATLKGSVTDPTTAVTTTGTYTKIGNRVMLEIAFNNVNTTGASGAVNIIGIPYTSANRAMGSVASYNFNFSGSSNVLYLGASSTILEVLSSASGAAWSNVTHSASASTYLFLSLTYSV
jgi:hypothetical protein